MIGPGQGWAWLGIGGAREPALDPNWAPRPGPARTRISKWKASVPLTYACGALAGKPAANTQYCRRDEARGEQKRHLVPGLYPQKKLAATVLAAYLTALFQLSSRVQRPPCRLQPNASRGRARRPAGPRRQTPPPPSWGRRGEPAFCNPRRRETEDRSTGERALHACMRTKLASCNAGLGRMGGLGWLTRVGRVGGERRVGLRPAESRGRGRGR